MKKSLITAVILGMSTLYLTGCSSIYDKHVQWQRVKPERFPVLKAIGQAPISLQKSQNKTQRMLMAIKASKLAAYAELAEQVYGQHINDSTTMANLIVNNQELTASVNGIIRGAKVLKSYPVGDTYTTELSLDFNDVYDLYLANSNHKEIKDVRYY
ncbi:hypothetical protein tinsulaeT_10090 [Thalassotalea insulae]|uniref:Flagellar biosynthesis protein FlgP n=1 Tax=Thalassotalea insulae TaxID=2056778 RepID=A0ABQ6GPX5_9GAMM|nr:LPP20 family lipoprotein [Thalassotalea insulae]GLX77669.1 hypothetical protein tinsulaeT_10090 [Thalassotalea insulae]